MTNEIINLSSEEFKIKNPITFLNNCFVVNINGNLILRKEELLIKLKEEYSLPDVNGWDSISDWLTDLSWIKASNFQLNIFNYSNFMSEDYNSKEIFLEVLSEDVLPFWETEVLTTVVEGVPKGFIVYCID